MQTVQTNSDEIPVVGIFAETMTNWVIRCPYCDLLHYHGKVEGHRVADCLDPVPNNRGYIIKRSPVTEGPAA